jgi:hypothetical protein
MLPRGGVWLPEGKQPLLVDRVRTFGERSVALVDADAGLDVEGPFVFGTQTFIAPCSRFAMVWADAARSRNAGHKIVRP